MHPIRILLLATIYLGTLVPLLAQEEEPRQIEHTYRAKVVLPETLSKFDNLYDPVQDSFGYVWFSSVEGLHCFDGNSLLTYDIRSDTSRTLIWNQKLHAGRYLYCRSSGSSAVAVFDVLARKVIKRIPFTGDRAHTQVDEHGQVYLLARQDTTTWQIRCLSDAEQPLLTFSHAGTITRYMIAGGKHWIQCDTEFRCFNADGDTEYVLPRDRGANVLVMVDEHDGELQFCTQSDATIYRWDDKTGKLELAYHVPSQFDHKVFDYLPHKDNFWLEHTPRGMFLWDPGEGTIQDYTSTITDLVRSQAPQTLAFEMSEFFAMRNGEIFLFYGNSIVELIPNSDDGDVIWENISSGNTLTSMRAMAEDDEGNIYASYYTGVSVKTKGSERFEPFLDTHERSKQRAATYSLTYVKDKLIWNNIIFNLTNGDRHTIHYDGYGLHMNHCLLGDTLWTYSWYSNLLVGYDIETDASTSEPVKVFPSDESASRLRADPSGKRIWMATSGEGICAINTSGQMVEQYTYRELELPLGRSNVHDIVLDGEEIWFGTELGLGQLNTISEEVRHYVLPATLPTGELRNRFVYNIIEIGSGEFFLATNRGLLYFSKEAGLFRELPEDHELSQLEFNRNSVLHAGDGRFYLGTIDGLVSFLPERLPFKSNINSAARPLLTSISILNQNSKTRRTLESDLFELKTLKLRSSDAQVSFSYSSPGEGADIAYAYRIHPLDTAWSAYGPDSRIDVLSFPAGSYTIEIAATTVPGSSPHSVTSFDVVMPRVWYKRWWAITSFVLVPLLIVSLLLHWRYNQRLQRQREMEALRTKISSDLHDDVGSILSGLAMQSEMMTYDTNNETEKSSLKEISAMSRDAMERMRDTVWAIDSRKDKFGDLVARMRGYAEDLFEKKHIEHAFHTSAVDSEAFINPEVRQNIYLIFKEALANIIRHSDATNVRITMSKEGRKLEMIIHDDGSRQPESQMDGLGISNMHLRAERIGGTVTTGYQDGFRVHLVLEL